MTFTDPLAERQARKEFVRSRQKVVFTIAIASLAVILVIALIVAFVSLKHSGKQDTQVKPNYGVSVPCPSHDAKYINHPDVHVRVLNGTNKSGLGNAVSKALSNRGFNMQTVADYPSKTELARTEIRFGAGNIDKGYTVAAQFKDASLRMDDRQDDLVDVIIGSTFTDLTNEKRVPGVGKQISPIANCQADPKSLKQVPKRLP